MLYSAFILLLVKILRREHLASPIKEAAAPLDTIHQVIRVSRIQVRQITLFKMQEVAVQVDITHRETVA